MRSLTLHALTLFVAAAVAAPAAAQVGTFAACYGMARRGLSSSFYRSCETRIMLCDPRYEHSLCLASIAGLDLTVVRDLPIADAAEVLLPDDGMESLPAPGDSGRGGLAMRGASLPLLPNPYVRRIEDAPVFAAESAAARGLVERAKSVAAGAGDGDPEVERAWGIAAVDAPAAWARGLTGRGVRVAVIDTGIDYRHHDLARAYAGGANIVDPSRANDPLDDEGHGTHVAGTIAAAKDGADVVGVAPEASIVAIKALDGNGSGSDSQVIAGIQWAVDHHVDLISMSLGGQHSEPICRAVARAAQAGILVVAAAGNDPRQPVGSPADCAGAVAVSALDQDGALAPFSSRGPKVAFIAPGVDIVSDRLGGGVVSLSGTSMATPHVAGLAALAIQAAGTSRPDAVLALLSRAARPLPGLGPTEQGRGLVDAALLTPASAPAAAR